MARAIVRNRHSKKQNIRRYEINRKLSATPSTSIISAIIALLTSIVCGGGGERIAIGIAGLGRTSRAAFFGGLLGSIISERTKRRKFHPPFVSALPEAGHCTSTSSFDDSTSSSHQMESCNDNTNRRRINVDLRSSKTAHPNDTSLWMYHVESTTSTMDVAKSIVRDMKHLVDEETDTPTTDYDVTKPTAFMISATSQSHGRGTTQRNWKSSQKGNALFTIGIPLSSWTDGLKDKNNGQMVPLTLLPLKVGSLVVFHVQRVLNECALKFVDETQQTLMMPRVTVKWPNDVLLRTSPTQGIDSHKKIAGILIESSQDWFLIGIGINVGYSPTIPLEGADYGRQATSVSDYCRAVIAIEKDNTYDGTIDDEKTYEHYWIQVSKKLARDIAFDLHSWLHDPLSSQHYYNTHSGETILNQWKSYIDWDMELVLRDTPLRERVSLKSILEDGRVVVQEVETGVTRTLVSDYFL
ncbi:hypothetical protein ACHAXH_008712 [Discostella pseudostelligera]